MYPDLMIDLETFDDGPNSTIVAIGAVAFDIRGNDTVDSVQVPERSFYTVVDPWEQSLHGRTMSADTLLWWLRQTADARMEITKPGLKLEPTLKLLKKFVEEMGCETQWSYGATFDNVVLTEAYKAYKVKTPIAYRNQFCMRTIVNLSPAERPDRVPELVKHNALSDAQYQVLWLQEAFRKLRI